MKIAPNSIALLPASQAVFNKNKVSVQEIASEWKDGIIQVMELVNYYTGRTRQIFAVTCGHSDETGKTGEAHHDQTLIRLGKFKIIHCIPVHNGVVDDSNPLSYYHYKNVKLPVYVYK